MGNWSRLLILIQLIWKRTFLEALLYMPVYHKATGLYGGLKKWHITLWGDEVEYFYSYGYPKEKITLLYCTMKHPLPNIFHCTAFKKHNGFILDENKRKQIFLNYFYISLRPSIEKRTFCSGKITFTCIQSMWTMKNWKNSQWWWYESGLVRQ